MVRMQAAAFRTAFAGPGGARLETQGGGEGVCVMTGSVLNLHSTMVVVLLVHRLGAPGRQRGYKPGGHGRAGEPSKDQHQHQEHEQAATHAGNDTTLGQLVPGRCDGAGGNWGRFAPYTAM